MHYAGGCFRLQRYKLLKAIHNGVCRSRLILLLFQTTKIQTFESNSQRHSRRQISKYRCFRLQRYKLLKAIHNFVLLVGTSVWLFQTTKIQTFESNSQPYSATYSATYCCFRLQRYKLLKAIHNPVVTYTSPACVVSDYKDTNF